MQSYLIDNYDPEFDRKITPREVAIELLTPTMLAAAARAIATRAGAPLEHSDSFEPIARMVLEAVIPLIAIEAHNHFWMLTASEGQLVVFSRKELTHHA